MKRAKRLARRERGTHVEAMPYAIPPGKLNRHWRRAIESIVRTSAKSEHAEIALARKLGDEVVMRPFAAHLLKQREQVIAVEKEKRESLYSRMLEHFAENAGTAVRAAMQKTMRVLGIDPASQEASRG